MTSYALTLPAEVISDARALASADGAPLDQYLSSLVAQRIGELKALRHVQQRIGRANRAEALAILRRAPDAPPEAGDEIQ